MTTSPVAPYDTGIPFSNPFLPLSMLAMPAVVGSVPVPAGDPAQLLAAAGRYAAAATELGALAARVRTTTLTVASGQSWCSPASSMFAAAGDATAGSYDNAAAACGQATTSLATYAAELDQAQQVARAANAAAGELNTARTALQGRREALDVQSSARPFGAPPDPGLAASYAQLHAHADSISQGAAHVATLAQQAQLMATDAGRKAAAAFEQIAAMTMPARQEAARAAVRAAAPSEGSSAWDIAALVGLSVVDLGLLAADTAQLGLDPVTDVATGVTVARTGSIAARLFGRGALREAEHQAEESAAARAAAQVAKSNKPEWLIRAEKGSKFHTEVQTDLGSTYASELYVNGVSRSGYRILDAYGKDTGEILSLKNTQLAQVDEKTALGYLRELAVKYAPGTRIATVPSSGALGGDVLEGQMILGVPVQAAPIPEAVSLAARRLDIVIREISLPHVP